MDPAKLKVVELRAELSKRGLDTKGNKPVLVERLKQALDDEKSGKTPAPPSDSGSRSELESEDDASEQEPARLPPRTPSRSSRARRSTSREPVTPAKTPSRRSTSRSSQSRQSPAKTILAENELTPVLEPIVEEDKKESPKKETKKETPVPTPSPKKETAPAPASKKETVPVATTKKEAAPVVAPKKEAVPATTPTKEVPPTSVPKKEAELAPVTPKKDAVATSPKKQDSLSVAKKEAVQNESSEKEEQLLTVKEAERHISEKSQEITRKSVPNAQTPAKSASPAKTEAPSPAKSATQSPAKPPAQSPAKPPTQSPTKSPAQSPVKPVVQTPTQSPAKPASQSPDNPPAQSPAKSPTQSPAKPAIESPAKALAQSPNKPATPQKAEQSPSKKDITDSPTRKDATDSPSKKDAIASPTKRDSTDSSSKKGTAESPAKKQKTDEAEPMETEKIDEPVKPEEKSGRESMDVDQENEAKTEETDEHENEKDDKEERKRKRSPSPQEEAPRAPPIARPENEPTYDENDVLLSWYDSDLNLVINTISYYAASPMQGDGFNYMWAGARASHGFNKGKVYYEAKVTAEFDNIAAASTVRDNTGAIPFDDTKIPSILRLGWSVAGTSLQLGEEKLSYGYEGSGKKATNNEFTEYGKTFAKNDVVGCYADFETDGNVTLMYTVNGESQGTAFVFKKEELEGKALIPHLLAKNCTFSVNFGQEDAWSQNKLEEYTFANKVDVNDRVAGPRRPEKRENCEVILLLGLPFSGKTSWAMKHVAENPDKLYSVLGTHNLIEKMKVDGVALKENFKGRWETLVEKCSRALNKLLESAPSRRRNYILDQQANVYASTQKRKMRNFYGFHRKAVVLVPSDEELKSRIATRKEAADGEEIREESLLELKANITVPTVGESFEEVIWPELGEEEGKKLIEQYNNEGKTAGFGQNQQQSNKRSRYDNGQNRNNRDRRPGFNDRRNSGPWRGGPPRGGSWRDQGRMSGSPMRPGGYGPPAPWRGRGAPPPRGGAGNDRRNDRNRPSGRPGGGWNAVGYQGGSTGVWANQASGWQGGQTAGGWSGAQSQTWGGQGTGSQQAWGGSGNWKGYSQNSYGGSSGGAASGGNYGQSAGSYGNGNWNNYPQYYNQYWGGSGGNQQNAGQTQPSAPSSGSQAVSTTTPNEDYDYSSDWQDYS